MKKLLDISSDERRRILEMHQSATRRNYLTEAPEQAASPQKVTGQGQGLPMTRLIFAHNNGSQWRAADFAKVTYTDKYADARTMSDLLSNDESSKSTDVDLKKEVNFPGEIALGDFYLLNYEYDGRATGGRNPGSISNFTFTPDAAYAKVVGGEVNVTLDFKKQIVGNCNSSLNGKIFVGSAQVFEACAPTKFSISYVTPMKKMDVTKANGFTVANGKVFMGTGVIKTNDSSNAEKTIRLYVPEGTQFGVGTASGLTPAVKTPGT